jgi:uncharacterized protein (DUF849 family)
VEQVKKRMNGMMKMTLIMKKMMKFLQKTKMLKFLQMIHQTRIQKMKNPKKNLKQKRSQLRKEKIRKSLQAQHQRKRVALLVNPQLLRPLLHQLPRTTVNPLNIIPVKLWLGVEL